MSEPSNETQNDKSFFDLSALKKPLDISHLLEAFKNTLNTIDSLLAKRFYNGERANRLVAEKSQLIDKIICEAWESFFENSSDLALVAVGGYGRGELHPGSDVDILILGTENSFEENKDSLERFLTFLWDIGLEIGHSVRTVKDCFEQGGQDITIATNLMESRLLSGSNQLYQEMIEETKPEKIWPSKDFFKAKLNEQIERHKKFNGTAYNLEPNIKEGVGGLRDIQMIGWVVKRHFGKNSLYDLVVLGFLTESEYSDLITAQNFLWDVRFALHSFSRRKDDRLMFDYQKKIAKHFGFEDSETLLGVEQFMQKYFRTITELSRLNEMILQLFNENILSDKEKAKPIKINSRFQIINGYIEARNPKVFKRYRVAFLEIFLHIIQNEEIKGIRADTIRLIRDNKYLIDEDFRNDIRNQSLFMEILKQPSGVSHELKRMHRYGVLGAYIPEFENIVGRMQYDLFHTYTVDSHTLFVVRYLRRFAVDEFAHEFPFCSIISKKLPKPELLYIAGLFHDIAKGRGGDHSELGAIDAYNFCKKHCLSEYDSQLVSWLVKNHLLMSMTAQRKDISLPEVINEFASKVVDKYHLDYLYLLTVADIRATNSSLWNSWRDALLRDLYISTNSTLRLGMTAPQNENELIEETKITARKLALKSGVHHMKLKSIWSSVPKDYFLRYTPDEILWHTMGIAKTKEEELPLIQIKSTSSRGGTELFIYSNDRPNMFAIVCSALDQLRLTIIDARIITSYSNYTFNTYLIVDEENEAITEDLRKERIAEKLTKVIRDEKATPSVSNNIPRLLKCFSTPTEIYFKQDEALDQTIIEIFAADKPGLLSRIGMAFSKCDLTLRNAKIATIGERAEDFFYVTGNNNKMITDKQELENIESSLKYWIELENSDNNGILEIYI